MREDRRSSLASRDSLSLWRWALWFAVFAGLGQALLVAVVRLATHRLILISPDVVWMAPVANAAVFGTAAIGLRLVTRRLAQSMAAGVALSIFVFLLLLGPLLMVPRLHPYAAVVLTAGLAIQVARMLSARADLLNGLIRRTLPALVGLSVALGLGLHLLRTVAAQQAEASLPVAAPGAPNVMLIVLDTVRAQSLSLYGYQRQTSPRLDEFARTGVVFERALSAAPWTLPSHASFFTGRLPHELSADWLTPLDTAHATLAEAFASRGYVTVGFVANLLYATAETGLNRGFIRYLDFPFSPGMLVRNSWLARALIDPLRGFTGEPDRLVSKSASKVNDEFGAWLSARPEKPFFAFLNYFDAHAPYLPPPPFDTKFGSGGPQPDIAVRRTWSQQEIQRSVDAYDGTLAYIDEQLGTLLEMLKAQHLLDNTLVVVTSDHGEQFGEHGLFDHANSLYRPLLQVPLVISFPSHVPAGMRVSDPVTLVNLPATILDLANITTGDPVLPGRSLADYWRSSQDSEKPGTPLFSAVSKGINMPEWLPVSKGPMQSVVVGGMHYIRNGDGREELYDFEHDVAEVRDLAGRTEFRAVIEDARRTLSAVH
jgi:arylsulfatase A-like enzyme